MNYIEIWEPRWSTKDVLLADHKLGKDNMVVIKHKNYPNPLYISGNVARTFPLEEMPTKAGGVMRVRAVPLDELTKEVLNI